MQGFAIGVSRVGQGSLSLYYSRALLPGLVKGFGFGVSREGLGGSYLSSPAVA